MCHLLRVAIIIRIHEVYLRIYPFAGNIAPVLIFGHCFQSRPDILQVAGKVFVMVIGKAVPFRKFTVYDCPYIQCIRQSVIVSA